MSEQNGPHDGEEISGEEEDFLFDQAVPEESSEKGHKSGNDDVPTLEEAADADFGKMPADPESNGSSDAEDAGGSPLSRYDPDDLER